MEGLIGSQEAANRLGIKRSTLYVYVSRGLLTSQRGQDGRTSLFDLDEVERFADRTRGGARRSESKFSSIATSVTQLLETGPVYRGIAAADLAMTSTFEEVATLLWQTEPGDWQPVPVSVPLMASEDMLRCAILMAGASDPLRTDQRPLAVARAARRMIATAVSVLPRSTLRTKNQSPSIATQLATSLLKKTTPIAIEAIDAALVLLADHELAPSTVAVRLAASARADVYNAVLAGLGVMAGPLHRSELAHQMLVASLRDSTQRAVGDFLRWHGRLPGLGGAVYATQDPRLSVLLHFFTLLASAEQIEVFDELLATITDQGLGYPNVDLGLAAITWALGAPAEAGYTIFTISRMAGSVAHYLEELNEPFRRFRSRGVFVANYDQNEVEILETN